MQRLVVLVCILLIAGVTGAYFERHTSESAAGVAVARSSGLITSDDEQIYYETAGQGDAVVLCHGAAGNHVVWYQQVPVLARSYRVITWDQRGWGESTNHHGEAGPVTAVADLQAILDHLHIDRVHLIGQSMGGWVALGFAVAHPKRVHSLILSDSIAGISTRETEHAMAAYLQHAATEPAPEALPLGRHPALSDELMQRDPARAFLYQELSFLREPPTVGGSRQRHMTFGAESLAHLAFPVLFIVGTEDQIFPPAAIHQAATLLPHARVVEISHAGHSPYFEQPEEWNQVVMRFLHAAP
jgi:3-oxoadipate enol-lactonase